MKQGGEAGRREGEAAWRLPYASGVEWGSMLALEGVARRGKPENACAAA